MVEGDIGGGLVLQRQITIPKDMPEVFRIDSSIIAHKVGAGSGGFSRFSLFYFINIVFYGEWVLVDKCLGLGLINRFNPSAVNKCLIHWGTGTVNLELWSEDRPVSLQSPLKICHTYEVKKIL
ncbi:hypothetical protein CFOL_v3_35920 [Cephalotus follicularis]|uniref:Uncharacterized protein n=1 Tax=Cephalotus follicularis TaxID=3775 RepID=A0A1Q3DJ98_CEPFO|nr:hypothetical protein CFOL_v3_35920 [Cephalotus follicularis]